MILSPSPFLSSVMSTPGNDVGSSSSSSQSVSLSIEWQEKKKEEGGGRKR